MMFKDTCLCLGETERRGEFDTFRCGQVTLSLEPLLQSSQLLVGEYGARLATSAVLGAHLTGE